MTATIETTPNNARALNTDVLEKVLIRGDLAALSDRERSEYYIAVCDTLGLNPLTKPFEYTWMGGDDEGAERRLILYARKDAADQLRKKHNISITIAAREQVGNVYMVVARAELPTGRKDESSGVVALTNKYGKPLTDKTLANAMMKAETKAKRRVTLSICGIGMLDETEVEDVGSFAPRDASEPPTAPAAVPKYSEPQPIDSGAPSPEPRPDGAVFVRDIRFIRSGTKRRGGEWKLFGITLSDGVEYSTIDSSVVEAAKVAVAQNRPVAFVPGEFNGRPEITRLQVA